MTALSVRPEPKVNPLVVGLQAAADMAGVSDRHLRKFFADGPAQYQPKLPVCRIGNRLTIRVSALEAWLAAIEQQGGTPCE